MSTKPERDTRNSAQDAFEQSWGKDASGKIVHIGKQVPLSTIIIAEKLEPVYPPGLDPDDPRIDLSDPDWIAILYPQLNLFEVVRD